jgi:hypothetical protein
MVEFGKAGLVGAHLRVARPTDQLEVVVRFYREGLGFVVLGEFQDHEGFDGVMLGHPEAAYHLEFTRMRGHTVGPAPTEDNLLVFYLPDGEMWNAAVQRLLAGVIFGQDGYPRQELVDSWWRSRH